jgi:TIR domain
MAGPFFGIRKVPTGRRFDDYIDEKITQAQCMVVLWSRHATSSHWVREEAAEGRNLGRLLPVLLERVQLPLGFRTIQAAELIGWRRNPAQRVSETRNVYGRSASKRDRLQHRVCQNLVCIDNANLFERVRGEERARTPSDGFQSREPAPRTRTSSASFKRSVRNRIADALSFASTAGPSEAQTSRIQLRIDSSDLLS